MEKSRASNSRGNAQGKRQLAWLPPSLRKPVFGMRRLTSSLRELPDFVIIGAMKCGTTSLHNYLAQHPQICMSFPKKEVHFFDQKYSRGERWYRAHFPLRLHRDWKEARTQRRILLGESTPDYIFQPHVLPRMIKLLPHVKLIVVLRSPGGRAISHYYHAVRRGYEHLPIRDAFESEDERLERELERLLNDENYYSFMYNRLSYLRRGRYAEQLEAWFQCYPKERVMILRSEDLLHETRESVSAVFEFLGCEPRAVNVARQYNHFPYEEVDGVLREWLSTYFKPHNRRLADLLGYDVWSVNGEATLPNVLR